MSHKENQANPVRESLYAWARRNNVDAVQVSAAEALGVTRGAVANWLARGYVSDKSLLAYSELVGCSPYEVSGAAHVIRNRA